MSPRRKRQPTLAGGSEADAAAAASVASLPPAGDERREELRRRDDALAEQIDLRGETVGAIDPSKLDVDREIAQRIHNGRFNQLEVSNAQPGYRYCWVRAFDRQGRPDHQEVQIKQTARIKDPVTGLMTPCWEIVAGSMPEATECKDVTSLRKIGDSILLRCREDYAAVLDQLEQQQRDANEGKYNAEFDDHVRREFGGAATVSRFNMPVQDWRKLRREAARGAALSGPITNALRTGTMPGFPTPGR